MIAVNASASSALTALKIIKPLGGTDAPTKATTSPIFEPLGKIRMSPGVSDALMKISQIVNFTKISELPAEHAEQLRSFGADAAVRISKPSMSDEEFQSTVMNYISEKWTGLEGFSEALANGTVKIQRAADVKGLGYETIQYDLYKGGNHIGGAGWDTINRSYYDAVAASGVHQGIGSMAGNDFYVTW